MRHPSGHYLIQPLSLDDRFLSTLQQSRGWHIHSVFTNTVNICALQQPLLTFSNQQADSLPLSLMTQGLDFSSLSRNIGDPVSYDEQSVSLNGHYIFQLSAPQKSHYAPAESLDPARSSLFNQTTLLLQKTLQQHARLGSFIVPADAPPFTQAVSHCLQEQAQALSLALSQTHIPNIEATVLSLLGLGIGLTPSGDDYLVGTLAALRHTQPHAKATQALIASIERHAIHKTNDISAQALICACQHYFKSSLLDTLKHLYQPHQAAEYLKQLLQTGATSGTDMAFGLINTLLLSCLEKEVL